MRSDPAPGEMLARIEDFLSDGRRTGGSRGSGRSTQRPCRVGGRQRRASRRAGRYSRSLRQALVGDRQRLDLEADRAVRIVDRRPFQLNVGDDLAAEWSIRLRARPSVSRCGQPVCVRPGQPSSISWRSPMKVSDCQSVERNSVSKILSRSMPARAIRARSKPARQGREPASSSASFPGKRERGGPFAGAAHALCEGRTRSADHPLPRARIGWPAMLLTFEIFLHFPK